MQNPLLARDTVGSRSLVSLPLQNMGLFISSSAHDVGVQSMPPPFLSFFSFLPKSNKSGATVNVRKERLDDGGELAVGGAGICPVSAV